MTAPLRLGMNRVFSHLRLWYFLNGELKPTVAKYRNALLKEKWSTKPGAPPNIQDHDASLYTMENF